MRKGGREGKPQGMTMSTYLCPSVRMIQQYTKGLAGVRVDCLSYTPDTHTYPTCQHTFSQCVRYAPHIPCGYLHTHHVYPIPYTLSTPPHYTYIIHMSSPTSHTPHINTSSHIQHIRTPHTCIPCTSLYVTYIHTIHLHYIYLLTHLMHVTYISSLPIHTYHHMPQTHTFKHVTCTSPHTT